MGAPFPFFGYLIVVIAALAFAGNNVFAVLSYESGTTPLTLITVRMAIALIALTILMLVTGRSILLARRERNAALALGVLQAVMSYCLMAAFDHIAVGLAVLIFYLYPVLTALGAWLMRQETLNRGIFIGLIGSFGGLALALGDTGATVSILGMALAAAAALFMTSVILLSAKILQTDNSRAVTVHMHISGALIFVVISLIAGEFSLPQTDRGWIGLICRSPVLYNCRGDIFCRYRLGWRGPGFAGHESRAYCEYRSGLHSAGTGTVRAATSRRSNRHYGSHCCKMAKRKKVRFLSLPFGRIRLKFTRNFYLPSFQLLR